MQMLASYFFQYLINLIDLKMQKQHIILLTILIFLTH